MSNNITLNEKIARNKQHSNSNVHRRRNLDTEPSASKILRDKDSTYFFIYRMYLDRWGPSPSPKRGRSPQFSAHVYCGQMAASIKMPFGIEVGLGPDDIVLDGDPATTSPKRERSPPPQFSAYVYCGHGRPSQLLLSSCTCWFIQIKSN